MSEIQFLDYGVEQGDREYVTLGVMDEETKAMAREDFPQWDARLKEAYSNSDLAAVKVAEGVIKLILETNPELREDVDPRVIESF